jgi:hypothetical protein
LGGTQVHRRATRIDLLNEAGGAGLELSCQIYAEADSQLEKLCAPYSAVIEIDHVRLAQPSPARMFNDGMTARGNLFRLLVGQNKFVLLS